MVKKIFRLETITFFLIFMFSVVACVEDNDFINNYIWPSDAKINTEFTVPLPEGFNKTEDYILQAEAGDSFSVNIMASYINDDEIILNETYKNSQNKETGKFIRLNGSTSAVKYGFPSLRTDFPIFNVNTQTGEFAPISSFAAIMLPQGTEEQWQIFFDYLIEKAEENGIDIPEPVSNPNLPDWWGPIAMISWDGIDLDKMKKLREIALSGYEEVIAQTDADPDFDYRVLQERMIFVQAGGERHLFKNILGIDVPAAAQRAFFALLTHVPNE